MQACPVCETENPDVARFCLACGAALSAEPRREERKIVTVLFADLVGFTSRAEQLDPEDVRAVLAPYWERLRAELEKRGGTVEKFIGDAVMALFGAPVAHDDDPLRAVGAALAIRDWAREEADVQVRIAVNTGEALVLLGARPSEGEGMAAGDVVNTTARLQSAAPVNGVLVGETTYRATRDVIEYVEREPVVAKGKTEPVPVWEAVQVRARLGVDVERATLPLVGRTRELAVIVDAFERARSEREPQLVTLVGVPGIGKSRLVGEFFARIEQQPELVWWRQGRALPYGDGVSFWAVADMVKAQAGVDENDSAEVAERKLRDSVERVVDEPDRGWVLQHLLPLVGGEQRPGGGDSAPAWRTYFEALAEQRPLVLVFEDMHWADDGLLDFIDHVVDWASGVPILVLATARPELLDRRRAWGGGKLNVATIALTPLSDEESAEVIHNVLEQSALPAKTEQALLEHAGGNPLYAEQFARLYMERGSADDLPLPETVQGLIAARIDGLAPEEKRLLQDAAVFGKVFWAGALGADADALHALERKGMLRRERRSAVAGEPQYAFRHVLVRDVAYGQIPRTQRADKHLHAADWIESLGRADDHAELVAHHVSYALDLGADVDARARTALRRAGDRAQALGAHPAAARYLAAALDLWPDDGSPDRARAVAAHAASVWRATSDRSVFPPALDALEAAGLHEEAADLAVQAANAAWYVGSGDVDALLERAERLLDGGGPSAARAALLAERGRVNFFRARHVEGKHDLDEGLRLAELLDLTELRAGVLTTTGAVRMTEGDLDGARQLFNEVAATAPPGSPSATRALANLATTESNAANAEGWRAAHAAAVERASRAGDAPNLRWLEAQAIEYAVDFGQWDEALRRADAYLADGDDPSVMLVRARILAARGAVAEARAARDTALAAIAIGHHPQTQIPVRNLAAWVAFTLGDDEIAFRLIAEAAPFVVETRHRAPGVTAHGTSAVVRAGHAAEWKAFNERCVRTPRTVAALAMLDGDDDASGDLWARVSPDNEAVARLLAAERLTHAGRHGEAESQLTRALAYYRAVGATKIAHDAEALLVA